jgi:hypothetical protein
MWHCRRMEKISWTDRVRNEVLRRVKEKRNISHTKIEHLAQELRSETYYSRKYRRKEISDGRKRKKT